MPGITTTLADGLLKEYYIDVPNGPTEQLNNATVLLAQLERKTDIIDSEGKEAVFGVHVTRNSSVAALAEGDSVPAAGNQTTVKARAALRTLAGRIQLTEQVIAAAASKRSAFRKVTDDEMKRIVSDLKRQQERMVHGTGDGKIATCGTTSASTTLQLASTTTDVQMRQLTQDGIKIDVGTLAAPSGQGSGLTVSGSSFTNKTLTVSSAVTTTSSHFVSLSGSGGTNPIKELNGLGNIVDDDVDLHGLSYTTYPTWKATVDTAAANRPATEMLLKKVADNVDTQGGKVPNLIVTSHGVERSIAADMLSRKRYNDTVKLKGGYQGVAVNLGGDGDAAMVRTRDCQLNTAYEVNTDHLFVAEWVPWGWFDRDGMVLRAVAGKLEIEAIYRGIFELCTDKRNAHGRADALAEA